MGFTAWGWLLEMQCKHHYGGNPPFFHACCAVWTMQQQFKGQPSRINIKLMMSWHLTARRWIEPAYGQLLLALAAGEWLR
jgi:hypothetical protein